MTNNFELINIYSPQDLDNINYTKNKILTIGNFDGIHLGHKTLINKIKKVAKEKNLNSSIITFHPHPAEVLGDKKENFYLNTIEEKIIKLKKLGINKIFIINFTKEFSKINPEDFLKNYISKIPIKHLIVGEKFKFGSEKKGDTKLLEKYSKENNFTFETISPIRSKNIKNKISERISSTKLREYLKTGKLNEYKLMKSENYILKGKVTKGDGIGKKLGFPTANININKSKIIPKSGVYAVRIHILNTSINTDTSIINNENNFKVFEGVLNIGIRPTVSTGKKLQIETHIFNFNKNIYNQNIEIELISYLREEKKFKSKEELIEQIKKDIIHSKKELKSIV